MKVEPGLLDIYMKMKKLFNFFFLLVVLFVLASCNDNSKTTTIEEEPYQIYSNLSYGEYDRNVLDFYLPKDVKGDSIILFIHGGAWISGDKSFYKDYMEKLAIAGIPSFSINYRYIAQDTKMTDLLDDIDHAVGYIKSYAKSEFDLELNQMALFGYSAGAHLSLLYGNKYKDTSPLSPKFIVSMAGPVDLRLDSYYTSKLSYDLFSYMIGKEFDSESKATVEDDLLDVSPIKYIDSNSIPTIIVQGLKDTTVDPLNATMLKDKLDENAIPYEYITLPNSDHLLQNDKDILSNLLKSVYNYAVKYLGYRL